MLPISSARTGLSLLNIVYHLRGDNWNSTLAEYTVAGPWDRATFFRQMRHEVCSACAMRSRD